MTVRKDVSVQSGDINKDYNLNKKLFHIVITQHFDFGDYNRIKWNKKKFSEKLKRKQNKNKTNKKQKNKKKTMCCNYLTLS